MSVKEKYINSLTPFNWKDYDAPELRKSWFHYQKGQQIFLFAKGFTLACGAYPGSLSVYTGTVGQEAYHPPLTTTEVKNEWSDTSNLPYAFMVCRQL